MKNMNSTDNTLNPLNCCALVQKERQTESKSDQGWFTRFLNKLVIPGADAASRIK